MINLKKITSFVSEHETTDVTDQPWVDSLDIERYELGTDKLIIWKHSDIEGGRIYINPSTIIMCRDLSFGCDSDFCKVIRDEINEILVEETQYTYSVLQTNQMKELRNLRKDQIIIYFENEY